MYLERRSQPIWLLGLGLVMTLSLGVAYGSVIAAEIGWLIGLISSLLVVYLWLGAQSVLRVDAVGLKVGKCLLEPSAIGEIEIYTSEDFALRIRQQALATDFLSILRNEKGGVVVEVRDARDPHRHWVIGTRNPSHFAQAIENIRP